jgi:hypothetical protein
MIAGCYAICFEVPFEAAAVTGHGSVALAPNTKIRAQPDLLSAMAVQHIGEVDLQGALGWGASNDRPGG